MNVNNSGQA
jgi:hypothetical protein